MDKYFNKKNLKYYSSRYAEELTQAFVSLLIISFVRLGSGNNNSNGPFYHQYGKIVAYSFLVALITLILEEMNFAVVRDLKSGIGYSVGSALMLNM